MNTNLAAMFGTVAVDHNLATRFKACADAATESAEAFRAMQLSAVRMANSIASYRATIVSMSIDWQRSPGYMVKRLRRRSLAKLRKQVAECANNIIARGVSP